MHALGDVVEVNFTDEEGLTITAPPPAPAAKPKGTLGSTAPVWLWFGLLGVGAFVLAKR